MKEEIQKLAEQIKTRTSGKLDAFEQSQTEQQLGLIIDICGAIDSSNNTLVAALDEARQKVRSYEDKSKGWMNSVHELSKDKETLTQCVRALARAIEGGES